MTRPLGAVVGSQRGGFVIGSFSSESLRPQTDKDHLYRQTNSFLRSKGISRGRWRGLLVGYMCDGELVGEEKVPKAGIDIDREPYPTNVLDHWVYDVFEKAEGKDEERYDFERGVLLVTNPGELMYLLFNGVLTETRDIGNSFSGYAAHISVSGMITATRELIQVKD